MPYDARLAIEAPGSPASRVLDLRRGPCKMTAGSRAGPVIGYPSATVPAVTGTMT